MNEIDRSRPDMLVFLEERYGWIPEAKLIEQTISGRVRIFMLQIQY